MQYIFIIREQDEINFPVAKSRFSNTLLWKLADKLFAQGEKDLEHKSAQVSALSRGESILELPGIGSPDMGKLPAASHWTLQSLTTKTWPWKPNAYNK